MESLKPFEASALKINRAKRHIEEFRSEALKFLESGPVHVVVEERPEFPAHLGVYGFVARIRAGVPHDLSAIIGDAFHNLRTSLDLMATDLVRLNGKNAEGVYFPFAKNADELDAQIRLKRMNRASPEAIKLVREQKPYIGGNAPLRALHDLDIRDKHQALIPSLAAVQLPPFILMMGSHPNQIPSFGSSITRDGQLIVVLPRAPNLPVGTELPATAGLVWGADSPFPTESVIPVLESLAKLVAGILEAFVALYPLGTGFPAPS